MKKITVLLPGGFKPPHMGHLKLANKFANNPLVNKVIVMVGPTERDGINRQQSLTIWNLLPTHPKVEIVGVSEENPMNAAFNYVFNLKKDSTEIVALGASAKSPEDAKRSQIFVAAIDRYKNKPTKDGKTAPKGVKAVNMTDDVPSNYVGRTDDKNGKSISASVLRQDIQNKDFENFVTNYPDVKTGIVKSIYNILKKTNSIVSKKSLKERIKNVVNNLLKEQDDDIKRGEEREKSQTLESKKKELQAAIEKRNVTKLKISKANEELNDLKTEKTKKTSTVTTSKVVTPSDKEDIKTTPSAEKDTKDVEKKEIDIDTKIEDKQKEIESLKQELKSNNNNITAVATKIRSIKNSPSSVRN